MLYKLIEDECIISLFTSQTPINADGYIEITQQEYNHIIEVISNKPQGNYMLTEDLEWVEVEGAEQ